MRQAKPGKGESDVRRRGNLHRDPVGNQSHPAKLATAGTESCVDSERSEPRSVDRKCASRAIEPRKLQSRGPRSCRCRDSTETLRSRSKRRGSGGVEEQGVRTRGSPRNLGGTVVSTLKVTGGGRLNKTQALGRCIRGPKGANAAGAGVVPNGEGNRARGTDGSGRSTFIVPRKQGNRPEGSLRREGRCREAVRLADPGGSMDRGRDRWTAH